MGDSELLPCPFCGEEPDKQFGFNVSANLKGRVICRCGAEIRQGRLDSESDIIKKWNRRTAVTGEQFAWAVYDGKAWVCVERAFESDEWMEKATDLMRDMWRTLSAMYGLNLGIDIGKERDYEERLREFGIGDER